jgi:hypothetical protein
MQPSPEEVTQLRFSYRNGDREALERLIPLVYDELRKLVMYLSRSSAHAHIHAKGNYDVHGVLPVARFPSAVNDEIPSGFGVVRRQVAPYQPEWPRSAPPSGGRYCDNSLRA